MNTAMERLDQIFHDVQFPNRWGEGAIFAFSGMDGPTQTRSRFVATASAARYGWMIHTPRRRSVSIDFAKPVDAEPDEVVVTGDVLVADTSAGPLIATFAAWHSMVGQLPAGTTVSLRFEDEAASASRETTQVTLDQEHGDAVILVRENDRWVLAYGTTTEEAKVRAHQALQSDLAAVLQARLKIYADLPAVDLPQYGRLFNKCVSVMKVNTLAPEGVISHHWSTPDRVPHRHMWLWDSVFHSFGMNHIDPTLAWEFLAAVLERQREAGMIPHCMHVDGVTSEVTQPPILAWGVWENYRYQPDPERLAYALPRLESYLVWNAEHRDRNSNGLLAWHIEATPTSRSGESGMDNSPRFDQALALDAVDFSTFQALDMQATAKIAEALGEEARADRWRRQADQVAHQIHTWLWHEDDGFYYDRMVDGTWSPVKAVSSFLPLLLDTIPDEHVNALVKQLKDPTTFWTSFSVPSVSVDDPAWSTDMWRGATWINLDYLVIQGLRKQGLVAIADALMTRLLHYVEAYYKRYGVLFEFYDAKDEVPPVACDRKGPHREPYDIRVKMDSIRDYHWTAALTADLLIDSS